MKILALDPSGNYHEGKGTTGWAYYYDFKLVAVGQLRAEEFNSQTEYWQKHLTLIDSIKPKILVVEDYKLYASTKDAQINSELETPQLIGVLKLHCSMVDIHLRLQPSHYKHRYTNEILLHKNIVSQDTQKRYYATGVPITRHILDAIRHGEYYINFKYKKERFNDTSNTDATR